MARASSSTSSFSSDSSSQIRLIVGDFVGQLSTLIEQDAVARARDAIMSAFSGGDAPNLTPNGKRRGRPPGSGRRAEGAMLALAGVAGVKKRKKAPIQLCPVPGCTNRAAPVFGMVCSKHKGLPKAEIRKFREARRAKRDKAMGKGMTAAKRTAPAKARRKPIRRKARVVRSAPRSGSAAPAKAAATA